MMTRTPTTSRAAAINPTRTGAGSTCARRGTATVLVAAMTLGPPFQEIDRDEQRERQQQQDDGDRRGLAVLEGLQRCDDEDRGDLGPVGHVARDEHDRAVLTDAAGEGEGEAGDYGG